MTLCPLQRHNRSLAALDHGYHMLGPKRKRFAFLFVVCRSVIDAGDAALVTRDVI